MKVEEKCRLLGLRLKSARLAKNLTQSEISKISGVSKGRIIEAEKGCATLETVVSILAALERDCDLDSLLSEMPEFSTANLKRSKNLRRRASGNQTHFYKSDHPDD